MKNMQLDYATFGGYYQLKLPLELDIHIPADDPVRLLSAFVEDCSLSALYANYGRIRKSQTAPLENHEPHLVPLIRPFQNNY